MFQRRIQPPDRLPVFRQTGEIRIVLIYGVPEILQRGDPGGLHPGENLCREFHVIDCRRLSSFDAPVGASGLLHGGVGIDEIQDSGLRCLFFRDFRYLLYHGFQPDGQIGNQPPQRRQRSVAFLLESNGSSSLYARNRQLTVISFD